MVTVFAAAVPATGSLLEVEELEEDSFDDRDELEELSLGLEALEDDSLVLEALELELQGFSAPEDEDPDFAFSASFCFFKASIFANFSFSASLELDAEPVVGFEADDKEEDDEEVEVAGTSGSGLAFSSCETSWMEKNSRRRNPRVRFTVSGVIPFDLRSLME